MRKMLSLLVMTMLLTVQVFAQSRIVTGVVKDETGSPIPFASIKVRGAKNGTQTAQDGHFQISVPAGKNQLEISNVGYTPQVLTIPEINSLDVTLVKASTVLEDVVVTGYTTQKKASVVGAVSTVSGSEIHDLPATDVGNLLQGKAAGVQVTAQNGAPGMGSFIQIRGVGSLAGGSDPLFVIDGVAADAQQYNMINPNDIASINVLKDASSSAIYGARGANGVIVITTRKGRRGRPQVNYHSEYSTQSRIPDNFKMMSSDQKLQYEYALDYTNPYLTNYVDSAGVTDITDIPLSTIQTRWKSLEVGNTDWFKVLLQNGTIAKNALSVSGADDRFTYFMSYNNMYQAGVVKTSGYNNNGGRINLTYKAYDWLTMGANTNVSAFKIETVRDRYNVQNPLLAAYVINPYEPEFNTDGTYNLTSVGFPIAQAVYDNPAYNTNVAGQGAYYLAVTPIQGLEVKSQVGLNYYDQTSESYTQPGSYLDLILNGVPTGIKTDAGNSIFNYVWTNTAHYTHTFGDGYNFGVLIGSEYTKEHQKSYSLTSQGFPSASLTTQNNGAKPLTTTTSKYDWSLFSLFIDPSFNYKERYYIDLSARRDGSSRFGLNTQYGNFFSAGAGWDIAKENFVKDAGATWLNELKVRAAIGTSGNFNIGNYSSQGLYNFGSYNGLSAAKPYQLANPNLSWEKQRAITAGVDFAFFKSRLTGSIDYYNQNRNNLLQNVPIPSTVGIIPPGQSGDALIENLGSMTNKGLEIALNYQVLKTRDWQVNVGGNVSFNKNVITKLTGQPGDSSGIIPNTATGENILKIGQPYYTYYMVRYAGVDPATGAAQYLDKNGKVTSQYQTSNSVALDGKGPLPKYFGGFNASATYKGITLSGLVYFSGGNWINNIIWENLVNDGGNVSGNVATDAANYWKKPGDKGVLPAANKNNPDNSTDRYLQNASFVRLRDVTLSYSLPKDLLARTRVLQDVNIYVTGHNLLTYRPHYKGDPEVGIGSAESDPTNPSTGQTQLSNGFYSLFSYPNYRAWTVGINVTF